MEYRGVVRSGDRVLANSIDTYVKNLGYSVDLLSRYYESSRAISAAMDQAISIDNYLHAHSGDESVNFIGKLAIAQSILEAEKSSRIYLSRALNQEFQFDFPHWHNIFCQILTEGVKRDDLEYLFDNVSFITFNYDRCIEHYIYNWIRRYYRLESEEAARIVGKMKIIHPYGVLGNLPWFKYSEKFISIEFGCDVTCGNLISIASYLKTFTEWEDDKILNSSIKKLVSEAQRIVFLGFSFGKINMDIVSIDNPKFYKSIIASSLGISAPNEISIRELIAKAILPTGGGKFIEFYGSSCNELMKDYFRRLTDGKI